MIFEYSFPVPIQFSSGDTFETAGNLLLHKRGSAIVQVYDLRTMEKQKVDSTRIVGNQINSLFLEVSMPGQNVSMTNVRENQSTGVILIDFSSGTQLEYPNWEAVGENAEQIDSTTQFAEKLLMGKAYRASPDGTNKRTQIGASVSCNLLADNPIVYTKAE